MPNWCNTCITIQCNDEEKAKYLYDKIEEWTSKSYVENDFGDSWLGNVVGFSGIGDTESVFCRGWIVDMYLSGCFIDIQEESAWAPALKMWRLIVDKYAPGADIVYSADEGGLGIYVTNDPCICGTYFVYDSKCRPEFDDHSPWNEAELENVLKKLFKSNTNGVENLLNEFKDSELCEDLCIFKYEYADVSEFE